MRRSGLASVASMAALLAACEVAAPPRDAEPEWKLEAERLEASGRPAQALVAAYRAVEAGRRPEADLLAAGVLARHREIGRALAVARRAAADYPGDEGVLEAHYRTALANQLLDEARRAAEALVARRPGDAVALRHLGILELQSHREEAAIERLEAACRLEPGSYASWFALGRAREAADEVAGAAAAYRRACALAPAETSCRWHLARLTARAAPEEALEILGDVDVDEMPLEAVYLAGSLEMRLGRPEIGRRLLDLHRDRQAARELDEQQTIRRAVKMEDVVHGLADGDLDRARRALAQSERLGAGREGDRLVLRAEILRLQGDDWGAVEALSRAVAARSGSWRHRYLFAEQLVRVGLAERSLAQLDRAATLQPLALEARELRLRQLRLLRPEEVDAEDGVVGALRFFALPEQRRAERDELGCLRGAARTALLFDIVQLANLSAAPGDDPIPLDDPPATATES